MAFIVCKTTALKIFDITFFNKTLQYDALQNIIMKY